MKKLAQEPKHKLLQAIVIEEISSIKKLTSSQLNLYLTTHEQVYCAWHKKSKFEHIAARIAAKKALRKLFPDSNFLEMEIRKKESGQPYFAFKGKLKKSLSNKKIKQVLLSMSHTKKEAIASVVCC